MIYNHPQTLAERFLSNFESLAQIVSSKLLKQSPKDFVSLDTVHGDFCLVQNDGTLVSGIRIDGSRSTVSQEEYDDLIETIEEDYKAHLQEGTHRFIHYFSSDTDKTKEELNRVFGDAARATASKIGFIDTSVIDEEVDALAKYCHSERNYLVVYTYVRNLTPTERKELQRLKEKQAKGMPFMTGAQSLSKGVSFYVDKHVSLLNSLREMFSNSNIFCRTMDIHELTYDIRLAYDSAWTAPDWKAVLTGDKHSLQIPEKRKGDYSHLGYPRLADQLMTRELSPCDSSTARIGDTIYAPLSVAFSPQNPKPFNALYKELQKANIPFRIHYDITNGGMGLISFQDTLATFLRVTGGSDNKDVLSVSKALRDLRDGGHEIVSLKINICTWAYNDDIQLAKKRRELIARICQSWGNTQVASVEGDVVESTLSSIPGLTSGNSAKPLPFDLHSTARLLPITQPASVWETGSRVYRTVRGKIIPCQPYSQKQSHWTKLVVGPMGFGKTVELASDNWSLVLHPDAQELPYIRQIDIGPGSKGLVDLVRSCLPESKQYLAQYYRIQNTKDFCVNPMDTQLGLRNPLSGHMSTLINIVSTLCLPDDNTAPPEGTLDVIQALLKLAYRVCAERKSSKDYHSGYIEQVDAKLEELDFNPPTKIPRWWDVVDFLAINKEYRLASLAQRYAVPTFSDLIALCSDGRIVDDFAESKTPTFEPIVKYVSRKLRAAMSMFPILSGVTVFDIAHSRIVSLDLDDVTKGKGPEAEKRTALMYTLAYHILTNDIYKGPDQLKEMEGPVGIFEHDYYSFHEQEIARLQRTVKRFVGDEVHRGRKVTQFLEQLVTMVLEGRKWGVDVVLASQLGNAFPEEIKELATTIIILGAGGKKNIDSLVNEFGLNDSMANLLRNSIRKPGKGGSTMIGLFDTKDGWLEQLLMSTKGPIFLWTVNSTRTDTYIVERLAKQIGLWETRKLLVHRYPQGSFEEEIETRRKQLGADDEKASGILDSIVEDNIKYYNNYFYSQIDKSVA